MCTSQGIILLQQLLLPPIFIHNYGVRAYGEWLTLSAAVMYLNTLNFGLQNFVNNELAMRYSRGEMGSFHLYQSTALRMLFGIAAFASALLALLFMVPIDRVLHLKIGHGQAATILFFLGLQVALNIPLNFFTGSYLVFGRAARGTSWQNVQRFAIVVVAAIAAVLHSSFVSIAILQAAMVIVVGTFVLGDLTKIAPELFPTLKYWDGEIARAIVKPTGYFALIFSTTFFAFQLPVLMLQVLLGPVTVVIFSVARTLFSMVRQGLACFTIALGPEVTHTYGKQDWSGLHQLYSSSERLLFTFIPVANLAVLAAAPILVKIWLHDSSLYRPGLYTLMALISCVMATKEHKHQFQFATNCHQEMARILFGTYVAMLAVSFVLVPRFGLVGFLSCWLVTEAVQTIAIVKLNEQLLRASGRLELAPLYRLATLIVIGTGGISLELKGISNQPFWVQELASVPLLLILLAVAGRCFGAHHLAVQFIRRHYMPNRFAASA